MHGGKRVHNEVNLNPTRLQGSASNRNISSFHLRYFSFGTLLFLKNNNKFPSYADAFPDMYLFI